MFDQGDIVRVSLEPVIGREIQGDCRPVLVLFAVNLTGAGIQTQGVALLNKIRMLDLKARGGKVIERVPDFIIEDALSRLIALLEGQE